MNTKDIRTFTDPDLAGPYAAMNAQDAGWSLWAQDGFHSIQSGPSQVKSLN
jgi:methenyltetrahydromethanopterin cyclohydrolase